MNRSETTSIRLSRELRQQLEQASTMLHRGKNWVITQALQEYIRNVLNIPLMEEAQRQSLLASKADREESAWDNEMDDSGWQ